MEINSAVRLLATDRRTVARRLFLEIDKFLLTKEFNSLDGTITFKCELPPVLTVLERIGFEPTSDKMIMNRDGTKIKITVPHAEWNPVLSVI